MHDWKTIFKRLFGLPLPDDPYTYHNRHDHSHLGPSHRKDPSNRAALILTPPSQTTTSTTASTTETAYTTTITTFTAPTTTTTTVDATTTVLFTKNGQYTTTDGSIFFLYPGTDFAGYDEFAGPCYAGNTVPFFNGVTTRPCQSYNDCLENCAAGRGAPQPCLGISYTPNGVYGGLPSCFLKFAVPGNGAPGCGAVQPNFVVDSAIYSGKV